MDIKCKECGESYDVNLSNCPKCGVANPYKKGAEDIVPGTNSETAKSDRITTPRTIEELQEWYVQEKLPNENTTRFFIGKNIKSAKAFGIYKDETTGKFVVYKNKANGSRAVRYEGKDEAYAVNELWNKLKEEILNQKQINKEIEKDYYTKKSKGEYSSGGSAGGGLLVWGIIAVVIFGVFTFIKNIPNRGYYSYNDNYYYYQDGSWYEYDDGWSKQNDVPKELKKNQKKYYNSYSYDSSYYIPSFENSSYYVEPSSSSSSSSWDDDDDYSWSSDDSWDSSSTDWDSDW